MYKETDWDEIAAQDKEHLEIASVKVPYSILENEVISPQVIRMDYQKGYL